MKIKDFFVKNDNLNNKEPIDKSKDDTSGDEQQQSESRKLVKTALLKLDIINNGQKEGRRYSLISTMVAVTQAAQNLKKLSMANKQATEEREKEEEEELEQQREENANRVREAYGPQYLQKTLDNAVAERTRKKSILKLRWNSKSQTSLPVSSTDTSS